MSEAMSIPTLTFHEGKASLLSDGKPFLIFGGECHNSSSSDLDYMRDEVWPRIRPLNLNTLFVPVTWEQLEPEPDRFDFSLVEGLIRQAEDERMKLVLLWFGLWKNGNSSYVPEWVKADTRTYFRMRDRHGKALPAISPLCEAGVERDAAAFARLLARLRDFDSQRTVLLVQVENEMGLLGDCRDFSEVGETAYAAAIPGEMAAFSGVKGSWHEAFGVQAPEIFMTYAYAKATERIASSGKREYPIPLYVNAWLEQFPWTPGSYPAGGPIARHMAIWKEFAPSISLLAPDIYLPDFEAVCREYAVRDNPLLIPEARPSMDSASNVFVAFGRFGALGFSPFAIEKLNEDSPPPDDAVLGQLNIMAEAFRHYRAGEYLAESYALLEGMAGLLEEYRLTPHLQGFTNCQTPGTLLHFANCDFRIDYLPHGKHSPKGGGLVLELEPDLFVICGLNFCAQALPRYDDPGTVEVLSITAGVYDNDKFVPGRRLNGDEFHLRFGEHPSLCQVRLLRHPRNPGA